MKKYKVISLVFVAIGLLLSHAMCLHIAYEYCNMLWGIEYLGYSAPASTAFFLAISYLAGIIISLTTALALWKKAKRTTSAPLSQFPKM